MNIVKKILNWQVPRDRFKACHGYFDLDPNTGYDGPMDSVGAMIRAGVMRGDGYGAFRPWDALIYAELATVVCRMAGMAKRDFVWRPGDAHWGARAVEMASAVGCQFPDSGEGQCVDWGHASECLCAICPWAADKIRVYCAAIDSDKYIRRAELCELIVKTGALRTGRGGRRGWA